MAYVCAKCGRKAKLPDYCCGHSMVRQGSYVCRTCYTNSSNPGNCCGQPMTQV